MGRGKLPFDHRHAALSATERPMAERKQAVNRREPTPPGGASVSEGRPLSGAWDAAKTPSFSRIGSAAALPLETDAWASAHSTWQLHPGGASTPADHMACTAIPRCPGPALVNPAPHCRGQALRPLGPWAHPLVSATTASTSTRAQMLLEFLTLRLGKAGCTQPQGQAWHRMDPEGSVLVPGNE